MIDVYAVAGTFRNPPALTKALAGAMMRWERVPDIPLFSANTAAFVHELPPGSMSDAKGNERHVRVNILTPVGVLDREKKLGVVKEMTEIVAEAAGDPSLAERTWVLIDEAPDGGWGIAGHAYTNAEIGEAARRELGKK
ncbi:MAG: tautomerase family protein [Thermoplasmata archaeon]|nr:tautomerase family protein [Thermoplasmata archaeon]